MTTATRDARRTNEQATARAGNRKDDSGRSRLAPVAQRADSQRRDADAHIPSNRRDADAQIPSNRRDADAPQAERHDVAFEMWLESIVSAARRNGQLWTTFPSWVRWEARYDEIVTRLRAIDGLLVVAGTCGMTGARYISARCVTDTAATNAR